MLPSPSPFREALRPRLLASVFGASLLVAGPALAEGPALPSGGSVAAGVASIATGDSGVTVTQSTNRAVVNWNSFSVGQGRTVAFDLPGANAAVLNRVTGDLPSSIAGALTSNGRVFLVNPNGVAITATGQVRVGGGFTASTLDISNADFMAGRLVFTGASRAEVSNAGAIYVSDGGQVALIGGGRVRNTGLISAPLGQVALGSGSAITLDPGGDGFLQILAPPVLEADGGVEVGGQVLAAGGRVVVRADAVERTVRDLVNLTGEVSVASARSEGGSVILDAGAGGLAASGRIDATSGEARGGRIALGGDSVTLSGARLDAGGASGGEITVGGGWQGAPVPGVTTARSTQVDAGSRLEASGSARAGGRVILWSDDDTRFRGRIQATGTGGDGGVAEVSSHGVYLFDGQVNLLSRGGKAGQLLLDPYNVTISTGADSNQSGFTATGDSAVINVTSLQNALAGASVTVSTGSSGTQAGNITLSNALSWSANTTLTLNAAGAITLNAAVTNSGTGSGLELISPGTISLASSIANSGVLTVNGSGTLSGTLTGAGGLVKTGAGALTTGASATLTWTGATTISSGTLDFRSTWNSGNHPGNIDIASGATLSFWNGNQTLSGVISGAGTLTTSGSGGPVLTLTGQNTFNGTIQTGSYSVTIGGSGVLGAGNFSGSLVTNSTGGGAGGSFRYASTADQVISGPISGGGNVVKDTAASTLTLTGAATHSNGTTVSAGTLVFGGASTHSGGGVTVNAGGTLRYSTSASQALNITGAGALIKDTAASTLTWSSVAPSYTGPITIDTGTLDLLNAAVFGGANAIAIGAAGTLRFSKWANYTHSGVISGTGTLTQAGVTVTLTGANTFNGTINITPANQSLIIGGSGVLGGGNFSGSVANTGGLFFSSSADQTFSGIISGTGGLTKDTSAASTLTLTGVNTFTGAITNTLGTLAIGGAGSLGSGTYAGAISNAGTLRYSSSADQTLSGLISGAGALVKDTAASTLTLSGANTYTGATTFGAGVVQLGSAGALGTSGALAFSGGTLRHGAANTVDYSTRILSTGGQLVRIDTNGQAVTWASGLSGAGTSLTKLGAGTLDLTANSGFTGGLTISEGELRFSGAGALGGGTYAGAISNAGTLRYSSTADQTFSGALSGAGALVKDTDAAAILTLTGANTLTGPITIDAGTLRIGGSSVLGGGAYARNLTNNGVLRYASSADQVLSGVISGTGSVVKDTSTTAVLTLSGANTFGGQLKVDAGKVELEGSWSPTGGAASVRVGAGALLEGAGVVSAATLTLAGPGHVDLDGPNQVDAIAATGAIGGVSLVNARSLSAGSIQATDAIRLRATGASDIILSPGAVLESAATGDAVVLGAGRNFQNNSGAAAVATPAGRWLVYSSRPADNQFGGLNSAQVALWGRAPMAAVAETGNRYVFSQALVLTVSTASFSKSFGQDISAEVAAGYSISGYDPGVSGAYLGDTFSTALTGAPSVGSDGARADAPSGTYVVYASGGSLAPVTGYALAFNSTGLLTVDQAVLTVRARSVTKVYDGLSLSTGAGVDITGWIPGDGPSSLSGVLTYTGSFVGASDAGTYQIQPGGLTSQNYTVKFLPGTLTITPAPLTVAVVPVSRTYDGGAFNGGNVTYAGLVNGQSASVLGGALAFGGTAQGAVNAGTYTLTASGLSSGNYTISYVPGALTIRPAPLTVTTKDASRTYNSTAWTGGAGVVIDGLVGRDVQADLAGTLTYGGTSQGAVNAGTYTLTASGLSSGNYTISYVPGTLTIRPAPLTVTAKDASRTYDTTAWTGGAGVVFDGLVGTDVQGDLTGTLAFGGSSQGAVNAGTYDITVSGLSSPNYDIRYVGGRLVIQKSVVTVAADPVTKSFDGTPFTGTTTVTVTGFAGQDTRTVLSGELVFTGGARGAVEIGTYEIVPSGLTSQNYEIRYLAGILQVVPAPVTVTARPRLEYVCRAAITLLGEQACQPVDDYAGFVDEPRASVDLFVPPPSILADGSPSSRMD